MKKEKIISKLRLENFIKKFIRVKRKKKKKSIINSANFFHFCWCCFFSFCDTSLFGFTIWKCYPWVWSVLQLSNYAIFNRAGLLQFSQLVWWSCLVSVGPNYWWNYLSRPYGYISRTLSHFVAAELYSWYSKCLCVPCTILFITHHTGHLSLDKGNPCMSFNAR